MNTLRWEYDVSFHSEQSITESKETRRFSCDTGGPCVVEHLGQVQPEAIVEILNERGQSGWQLVQVDFSDKGMLCFWKRQLSISEKE